MQDVSMQRHLLRPGASGKHMHHFTAPHHLAYNAAIFIVALALRCWFNFVAPHINNYNTCDAWEYLSNAAALWDLRLISPGNWSDSLAFLAGSASDAVKARLHHYLQPLQGLAMSGPTYPVFLLCCFLIAGKSFDTNNWAAPVAAQCVLSSITCLGIAAIGARAWNQKVGWLAGFIAALYPGFIINSGRLTTETFACFLVTAAIWLSASIFTSKRHAWWKLILLGTTCGALPLTRSVLILVSPVMIPAIISRSGWKKKLLAACSITAGLIATIGVWCLCQTLATGQPGLLVDRESTHNFALGSDQFTGGWAGIPLQTLNGAEKKSLFSLAVSTVSRNPAAFLRLSIDKVVRLFKFPCNDFRACLGPYDCAGQTLFHQIILLLAGCGLMLCIFSGESSSFRLHPRDACFDKGSAGSAPASSGTKEGTEIPPAYKLWCRILIVSAVAVHLAYVPFSANARYALTAMPFVILLAAAAVDAIPALITHKAGRAVLVSAVLFFAAEHTNLIAYLAWFFGPQRLSACLIVSCLIKILALAALGTAILYASAAARSNRPGTIFLALALSVVVVPAACLQTRAHGRWYEWQSTLSSPGQRLSETIVLNGLAEKLKSRQCYLLIDADGWQQFFPTAIIKVNGKTLHSPIIPGLSMPDCIFWYATRPGGGIIRHYEQIIDMLSMAAGVSASDLRQWFLLPLPGDVFSSRTLKIEVTQSGHVPIKAFGAYQTRKTVLQIPSVYNYSWDKVFYAAENERGLSDSHLDQTISRLSCPPATGDLSVAPGLQSGNFNIRLLVPPEASDSSALSKIMTAAIADHEISVSNENPLSIDMPLKQNYGDKTLWLVRISGKMMRSSTAPATPAVSVILNTLDARGKRHHYPCPWTPTATREGTDWLPFDFAFPVKPGALPGKLTSITVKCQANHPLLSGKCIPRGNCGGAKFAGVKLAILKMPVLPVERGYEVY